MPLKIPNVGERRLLIRIAAALDGGAECFLFQNNVTPDDDTEMTDLAECDFEGYAAVVIDNGTVDAAPDTGGRAVCAWDMVTFTRSAGATDNTVYGYGVRDATGDLLWAERFTAAVLMEEDAEPIEFEPKLTFKSEN